MTAPEIDGAERGAWLQSFNANGRRLLNLFPGAEFLAQDVLRTDVDGNGKAEIVLIGTELTGAAELQLRNTKGGVQDRQRLSTAGAETSHFLGPFELDGLRGDETAIASVARNGKSSFSVWGVPRGGKKLKLLAEHSTTDAKSSLQQFLPVDVDGDGPYEIAVAYAATSEKGSTLRVFDPRTGDKLVDKRVLKTKFDQATWGLGDFDPGTVGAELLVGYRNKTNALFKVLTGNGKELSKGGVAGKAKVHPWGAIRSAPGRQGNSRDLVFVGFSRPDGEIAFEVSDPSTKKATRVGAGVAGGADYEVLGWQVGNFDGDADTGDEIVAITRFRGDGTAALQAFDIVGRELGPRVQAFDGTYLGSSSLTIVFERKGRADLALVGRQIGKQPVVRVWNVLAGKLIREIGVLSPDVDIW